jgi:hypothetical protein
MRSAYDDSPQAPSGPWWGVILPGTFCFGPFNRLADLFRIGHDEALERFVEAHVET